MLSGFVNILTESNGALTFIGDLADNSVLMQPTSNAGEYAIGGLDGTLLRLNGGTIPVSSLTIADFTGSITVELGDGDDSFRFQPDSVPSVIPADLIITNANGDDTTVIGQTRIRGNLSINRSDTGVGDSTVRIIDTTIVGDSVIDNVGALGGNSDTLISGSFLLGALLLLNGEGDDIFSAANSQFGETGGAEVQIDNGDGESSTAFTGNGTIFGDLFIENGDNGLGQLDIVTIDTLEVVGAVELQNGNGDTNVIITNSRLGTRTDSNSSVVILNGAGFDSLSITNSAFTWSLVVNNDLIPGGESPFGSDTTVVGSQFGAVLDPVQVLGLVISGDNGRDSLDINNSIIRGALDLAGLFAGNNSLSLHNLTVDTLEVASAGGSDSLLLDGVAIVSSIDIDLGSGIDTLTLSASPRPTTFPPRSNVAIDGGPGIDTLRTTSSSIEVPIERFVNFEIFDPRINHSPVSANTSQATIEDSPYTFQLADFAFSDPNDTSPDQMLAVRILTLPAVGSLLHSGQAVNADQFIATADISSGALTWLPPADAVGSPLTSFSFAVQDSGGTANGASDLSAAQTFSLTVTAVNDVPRFQIPENATTVLEDAGPQTVAGFASGIAPGPETAIDEANQSVDFHVTVSGGNLTFSSPPAIDPATGNLTYTTAANSNGTAIITVELLDGTQLDGAAAGRPEPVFLPETGSYYTLVTGATDWPAAFAAAQTWSYAGRIGRLATIGSQIENDFLRDQFSIDSAWIGGFQGLNSVENAGGYRWITDEPFTFTEWMRNEPNNNSGDTSNSNERFITFDNNGGWNDLPGPPRSSLGYFIEYPATPTPARRTFTITASAVNDAPEFSIPASAPTVVEDAGLQAVANFATGMRPGPPSATDEANQSLTFDVSVQSTAGNLAFTTPPSIDRTTGTLSYTAAPNTSGTATIRVVLRDESGAAPNSNASTAQSFVITVAAINDTPEFSIPATAPAAAEDAGPQTVLNFATGIRSGPQNATDEANQELAFDVDVQSTAGNLAFTSAPRIDPRTGSLTYTTAPDTNGTATLRVVLRDSGNGVFPNIASSVAQTFVITVADINDAPEFSIPATLPAIAEDDGPQNIPFATGMRPGPLGATDENAQVLAFSLEPITTTGGLTFTADPVVDLITGELTFTAAPDSNGTATFFVTLNDSGAGNSPDVNARAVTLTITVTPVNDAPSFVGGADQRIIDARPQVTLPNWATNIRPGPDNEAEQGVEFRVVGNDNPALFAQGPFISPEGLLTFTPSNDPLGSATIIIELVDDAGTALAGVDRSQRLTFTIEFATTIILPPKPPIFPPPSPPEVLRPILPPPAEKQPLLVIFLPRAVGRTQLDDVSLHNHKLQPMPPDAMPNSVNATPQLWSGSPELEEVIVLLYGADADQPRLLAIDYGDPPPELPPEIRKKLTQTESTQTSSTETLNNPSSEVEEDAEPEVSDDSGRAILASAAATLFGLACWGAVRWRKCRAALTRVSDQVLRLAALRR